MGISIVTLILNSSFQIMGVDLSEFKYLFFSFLPLFLKDYVQTLIASGVIFGTLGLLISTAFGRENKDQKRQTYVFQQDSESQFTKKENTIQSKISNYKNRIFKIKPQTMLSEQTPINRIKGRNILKFFFSKEFSVFAIFIFLLWCHSIIVYPQLYGEFFFYRFAFLRFFSIFTNGSNSTLDPTVDCSYDFMCMCSFSRYRIDQK